MDSKYQLYKNTKNQTAIIRNHSKLQFPAEKASGKKGKSKTTQNSSRTLQKKCEWKKVDIKGNNAK